MVAGDERGSLAWKVAGADAGERVDRVVARMLGASVRRARALCLAGAVRLDGRPATKGTRARAGQRIEVELPRAGLVGEPEIELDVRLERPDLVVVRKPAGIPTVPLAPEQRGSLAAALVGRYPEMANVGHRPWEPGLIHRLDTNTSGLVVAARTGSSFERLVAALREGRLEKRYLAVVVEAGIPQQGVIDRPLGPDPRERSRVRVVEGRDGYRRKARTAFRVLSRGAGLALVEVSVARAFRHQIRAHLAHLGHPLVGDLLYGGPRHPRLPDRHALHASYVACAGDTTLSFAVSDEAPADFLELLEGGFSPGSES